VEEFGGGVLAGFIAIVVWEVDASGGDGTCCAATSVA
jgi:hypothetical protein